MNAPHSTLYFFRIWFLAEAFAERRKPASYV
jgi:hypothetical protein